MTLFQQWTALCAGWGDFLLGVAAVVVVALDVTALAVAMPDGPGSHASHEVASASSPSVSIPIAKDK